MIFGMWRTIQRKNITSIPALLSFLELSDEQSLAITKKPKFILNLPVRLASKIKKGTLDDPILRQFVPLVEEEKNPLGFVQDPVCDTAFQKTPRLLQKYSGRALLVTTGACAMHCRYCFRQNYDYQVSSKEFVPELTHIKNDETIHEVILSGGDPLSLSNDRLGQLLGDIDAIPHIKKIRFHSRFPIGIPERIDPGFIELLSKIRCQIWFVIHCNHPAELDEDVCSHLKKIRCLGIPVLNQAVLLKGVNDSLPVLKELCEKLVDNGIAPYYIHQLDRVAGTAHFEVEEAVGKQMIIDLAAQLPGYAVPKYVREVPYEANKMPL
jgi:EF-P beta-lysylation protein EpmB